MEGNHSWCKLCLSLIDIAFRAIQPVFFSTPIELGGLSPAAIGNVLSIFGLLAGIFELFFFTRIVDRLGAKATFIVGIAAGLPAFASFPIMNYLARQEGYSLFLWIAVGFQLAAGVVIELSYGAIFIFVQGSSPTRASLGATNGLCQMTVSLMRAVGPAMANSLFSLSMDKGYLGGYLVYYILMGVVGMSLYVAFLLPKRVWS